MTRQQEDYQLFVDVWRMLKAYGQPDGSIEQQAAALAEGRMLEARYESDPFAADLISMVLVEIGARFRKLEAGHER